MYCGLQMIERACGPLYVGLSSVQMILPADVANYPRRGRSGLYETDLVLKAGAVLHKIEFDPGTAGWRQETRSTPAGDVYRNSISLRIKKSRPEQASFLAYLKNKRVHLVVTDEHNQRYWLMHCRVGSRAENGPRGGRNHYNYTFQCVDQLPTAFLAGQITNQDGNVLVAAVLQSPDGNHWRLAIGICEEPIAVLTTDTNVVPADFRVEDTDSNTYELTIDNCGTITVSASSGTAGQILLDAPDGNTYELSVGTCETLITIRTGSDLPGNENTGG